ncbi:glycine--tRNA ligase subunit beta [Rickettsia bellii]|uniref:Glycine--tRNA ligase beta subunit n=2 Tax=Rickettsia bellii TaxID=33990 RepID=SYGB_RICBR|nr:glycine--tRNA ligase subunit beta [Rickettsia bellii]A8GUQ4.1 RecName: Full=Glycine--tRNA ligase beta subunit; AltName: Full=Glycyl-tRNA synthetase beta subunit; Short=GlyRS [Rickettsia bellii OSU 85-389]Q1RGS4.1 RecName: Full=Glycine--tRNA ligase beta subunit; AltName: Full=Glycyl-tRNA synthetase beta subunit; Short=GlyRS [Rickettsia bellii RML369-C]ABE05440.1 Glycyl-tRNA synthetase beta chain [Rickettsia bellii RML369-C]ABV78551.1 glycyl-tRNA synthetase subunit beta [Rickettsia bellii OSU 
MSELLLELFSEEIPAFIQKDAEEGYLSIFTKIFEENEIFAKIQVFSGPRRITLYATHLPKVTLPKEIEIKGPSTEAPEAAINGFCKAHNVSKLELSTKLINNQLYYFYIKKVEERQIKEILPEIIVEAINKYSWAKSMFWGNYNIKWIRPLRNILCIFDSEILPLQFGHLAANNVTFGHRLTDNKKLEVTDFEDYKTKLTENYVILERLKREEIIKTSLLEQANSHNLTIKEDLRLIEEVAGLSEFPVVLCGAIPQKFLELPKEVLISSMRTHQKYFCLFDRSENFAPYFLFVSNGQFANSKLVVQGNEKVLSARLSDALYFYKQDISKTLEANLEKLAAVTFHTKLGSLKEKVERITNICKYIDPDNKDLITAAKLCKSDLVSEMVGEFPELQGIMGYYYAKHENLNEEIAVAIRDHYKPQGLSDSVPVGNAALLAIADKLDSLVGLMIAGEAPTGSGDPYALRRQVLGIIRIIIENKLELNLNSLIDFSLKLYSSDKDKDLIISFFEERAKFYFKNEYDISLINAVLDLNLANIKFKLDALKEFLEKEDGKQLLNAYKRASNILGSQNIDGAVEPSLFNTQPEKELFEVTQKLSLQIVDKDYDKALNLLQTLLTPITSFFDNVLVNDSDPKIAKNRLLILQDVCKLFHKIAKFNRL